MDIVSYFSWHFENPKVTFTSLYEDLNEMVQLV